MIGTNGTDTIGFNPTTTTVGGSTATFSNIQTRIVDPLAGSDTLSIASGLTVFFPVPIPGGGVAVRTLATLSLGSSSTLIVPAAANRADRTLLISLNTALGSGATINLVNNDADFPTAAFSTIYNDVKSGYNAGGSVWTGTGIDSSAAASDPTLLTALAVVQNTQNGTQLFSSGRLFDGTIPGPNDTLVKYTYYGDTNLDGKIDGSDYSRIDNAFTFDKTAPGTYTGWYNGDFNYDGTIDGSDYTLIDNAFNRQGASLAATVAAVPATRAERSSTAMASTTSIAAGFVAPPISQPLVATIWSTPDDSLFASRRPPHSRRGGMLDVVETKIS